MRVQLTTICEDPDRPCVCGCGRAIENSHRQECCSHWHGRPWRVAVAGQLLLVSFVDGGGVPLVHVVALTTQSLELSVLAAAVSAVLRYRVELRDWGRDHYTYRRVVEGTFYRRKRCD